MKRNKIILLIIIISGLTQVYSQGELDYQIGENYYNEMQYTEALPYLQNAAKAGNPKAQTLLGDMYCYGIGVIANTQTALNMYNKAISQNYTPAMISIGSMYEGKNGITANPTKAFEFYKKAADLGDAEGYRQIGLCYMQGYGVNADSTMAFNYIYKSAQIKPSRSYESLADCYYFGIGTELNLDEAFKWYEKSNNEYRLTCTGYYRFASELLRLNYAIRAEELLSPILEYCEDLAEIYPQIKEAANVARERVKIEKLYEDARLGCQRFTFNDGNYPDSFIENGKCTKFDKNSSFAIGNKFKENCKFSATFWIKDFTNGKLLQAVKVYGRNDFINDFPSIEILDDKLVFTPGPYGDNSVPFSVSLKNLNDGKWHFIAVTFGDNTKKLYIDCKLKEALTCKTSVLSQGNAIHVGGKGLEMKLSNLRIYGGNVLSNDEVKAIYTMELEGN